ncbi:MAG: hypothetical protein M3512_05630 [Bacteroidota bacterium]|nr:hypothetical protein [Bacteroidota bacterium]
MRNNIIIRVFVFLIAYVLISCSTENAAPNDNRLGFAFFPLKGGQYNIYAVEKTSYKITGEIETTNYLLKEAVADSFLNETNTYTYLLHRSIKLNGNDWRLDSVWSARKTNHQAIIVENNIPYVKLIFPFSEKATWDGNRLNTQVEEPYIMENINQPITLNNQTFDKAVTIVQKDNEDSIIFLERRKEIYAQDIGLIYKESAAIKYCAQVHCIGKGQIDLGELFKQTFLESGKE